MHSIIASPTLYFQTQYLCDLVCPYLMQMRLAYDILKFHSDRYGHHCLTYIMIGKMGLYNYIRDEICHFLSGGGLGLKIESLGLLPDESDRRPADLLTIPSALCRQSSWHFLPRIAMQLILRLSPHFGWQEGTWLRRTVS